jgi:hypothetical protein
MRNACKVLVDLGVDVRIILKMYLGVIGRMM